VYQFYVDRSTCKVGEVQRTLEALGEQPGAGVSVYQTAGFVPQLAQ
jgi:hypothetical protein